MAREPIQPKAGRTTLVVFAAVALLCFWRLGARDLTYFDEPRYAGVARGMVESGDWVLPSLYGRPYTEKPPLWFWLAGLSGRLFGFESFAWFLPNALAHFLCALLVFDLARRFEGRRAAALAALFYASCPLALHYARSAQLDPLLVFCETAAAWGFLRALAGDGLRFGYAGAAALAAGVLVKGHVALFALLAPLAFAAVRRDFGFIRRPGHLLAGTALVVAPFAAWFGAVAARLGGERAIDLYLRRQVVERTAGKVAHWAPVPVGAEYLGALAAMLPSLLFVPAALRRENAWRRACLLWAGAFFAVFALVPVKREIYLLPLAVPLALVAGGEAAGVAAGRWGLDALERWGGIVVSAVCAAAALAAPVAAHLGGVTLPEAWLAPVAAGGAAVAALRAFVRRSPAAPVWFVATVAAVQFFGEPVAGAIASRRFEERALGEAIQRAVPPGESVYVLGFSKAHAEAYFGRRPLVLLDSFRDLRRVLAERGEACVVARGDEAERIRRARRFAVEVLWEPGKPERKPKVLFRLSVRKSAAPAEVDAPQSGDSP